MVKFVMKQPIHLHSNTIGNTVIIRGHEHGLSVKKSFLIR
jgi:hypothetical protein